MLGALRGTNDITAGEYKRALVVNGLEPDGLNLAEGPDEFAREKILFIYNDGQKPRDWPYADDYDLEPHEALIRFGKRFTSTIEYKTETSDLVKAEIHRVILEHQAKRAGELTRLRAQLQFEEDDLGRFEQRVGADEAALGAENAMAFTNVDGSMY
jgi:hypothetical protein